MSMKVISLLLKIHLYIFSINQTLQGVKNDFTK